MENILYDGLSDNSINRRKRREQLCSAFLTYLEEMRELREVSGNLDEEELPVIGYSPDEIDDVVAILNSIERYPPVKPHYVDRCVPARRLPSQYEIIQNKQTYGSFSLIPHLSLSESPPFLRLGQVQRSTVDGVLRGHVILTCNSLDDLEYFVDPLRPGESRWNKLARFRRRNHFDLHDPNQQAAFHLERVISKFQGSATNQSYTRPVVFLVETIPKPEHWEALASYSDIHVVLVCEEPSHALSIVLQSLLVVGIDWSLRCCRGRHSGRKTFRRPALTRLIAQSSYQTCENRERFQTKATLSVWLPLVQ